MDRHTTKQNNIKKKEKEKEEVYVVILVQRASPRLTGEVAMGHLEAVQGGGGRGNFHCLQCVFGGVVVQADLGGKKKKKRGKLRERAVLVLSLWRFKD